MRLTTSIIIVILCAPAACNKPNTVPSKLEQERNFMKLIEALRDVPVKGPSFGAPVRSVSANSATQAVVREGPAIVPALIAALDHSSWNHSVWIVFCLRELRARDAKARIIRLKDEEWSARFASEPHDLTLDMLIETYLRIISEQPLPTDGEK